MVSLFALVVFGVVAYRMMSPAQRGRAAHTLVSWLARLFWHETPASAAFGQALRERTRWTLATPALIGVNVLVFVVAARLQARLPFPRH